MEKKQSKEKNRDTDNRNGEKLNDEQLEQINGGGSRHRHLTGMLYPDPPGIFDINK